jgi:hypothetical protein
MKFWYKRVYSGYGIESSTRVPQQDCVPQNKQFKLFYATWTILQVMTNAYVILGNLKFTFLYFFNFFLANFDMVLWYYGTV